VSVPYGSVVQSETLETPEARGIAAPLNLARNHPVGTLWLSIAVWTCLILSFTKGRFTTNDDVLIRSIASGNLGGAPDPHLVFINVVVGGPLSLLYRVAPFVPWYAVMLNGAVALAAGALGWALLRDADKSQVPFFAVVVGIPLTIGVLLQTFTASATIATAAGVAVHFVGLRTGASRRFDVVALLLVLLGFALRADAAWFAIALGETAILLGDRRWFSLRHLFYLMVAIAGAFALKGIDFLAYRFDNHWHSYKLFIDQLGQLSSTPRLGASPQLTAARIKAGWSANDVFLLDRWLYTDRELFSRNALATLVDGTRAVTGGRSWNTAFHDDIFEPYKGWLICIIAAFVAMTGLAWRSIAAVLGTVGVWMVAGTYLALFRHFPERVAIPGLAGVILVLGPICRYTTRSAPWVSAMALLPLIPTGVIIGDVTARASSNAKTLTAQLAAMDRFDDQATYVLVGSSVDLEGESSLKPEPSKPERSIVLSWPNFAPPADRELAGLGIDDPIVSAARRDDVYLVVPAASADEYLGYVNNWLTEQSYSGPPLRVVEERAGLAFLS